ncbi:BNR-4 repeat-containing protein [Aestuariivivens insulae]|uniref:BNR-4 repeat-containing protein n=1 Tax=Aestuariivivens insulae TaxID=1621988 RepID=UPI001F55E804|nr:BNR-4 repeat-containing protein [Aestuariivivens insulae]
MKKKLFQLALLLLTISTLNAQSPPTVTSLFDFTDDGSPGNTKNAASFAYHENIAYVLYVDNNVVNDSIYPGKICSYNLDTGEVIRSSFDFPTLVTNTASSDEGHNQSAIAVDGDGFIHVWIGMHNHKMKYWRSNDAYDIENFTDYGSSMPGYNDTGWYTDLPEGNDDDEKLYSYPYAATTTNGDVFVILRRTANYTQTHERQDLYHWNNITKTWSMDLVGKQHGKNAYMSTLFADNNNNLHIVTAWSQLHSGDNTFQRGTYMRYDVDLDKYFKADGTEVSVPMSVDGSDADLFYPGEAVWDDTTCEIQTPRVTVNSQGQPVVMYPYNTANNFSQNNPDYVINIARWDGSSWVRVDDILSESVKNHYRPPMSFTGGWVNVYARDINNVGLLTSSYDDGATFDTPGPLTGGGNSPVAVLNYSPDTDLYINKRILYKVIYPESNPTSNNPPTVTLTSPTNGAQFDEGTTISIAADASDSDGYITKVEFFDVVGATNTLLYTDTTAPYSYNWNGASVGDHTIRAKAFDDLGATKTYANDITVNSTSSETNLAINNLFDFSKEQNGNKAVNAVDDDTNTYWAAKKYAQWIELDFGADKAITRSELVCLNDRAYQFTIEAKPDGGSYSTIVDRSNNTTPGTVAAPIEDTFSTTARYVKLTVTGAANYSGPWISIPEFRVFGTDTAAKSSSSKKTSQNLALDASVKVFPNPTKNFLKVKLSEENANDNTKFSIYNIQGRSIPLNTLPHTISGNTLELNVSSLASGLYFISVKNNKNTIQHKFYKH